MLPEEEVRALMEAGEGEVDLEALEVRFAGRAVPFELDAERRHRLLNGLDDIALTLQKADDIAAYEASRERPGPVTLNCDSLDHFVIAVTDWERRTRSTATSCAPRSSSAARATRTASAPSSSTSTGRASTPTRSPRDRVRPGNSDLCFLLGRRDQRTPWSTSSARRRASSSALWSATGPQARHQVLYFRDPDGSLLEFITYLELTLRNSGEHGP